MSLQEIFETYAEMEGLTKSDLSDKEYVGNMIYNWYEAGLISTDEYNKLQATYGDKQ